MEDNSKPLQPSQKTRTLPVSTYLVMQSQCALLRAACTRFSKHKSQRRTVQQRTVYCATRLGTAVVLLRDYSTPWQESPNFFQKLLAQCLKLATNFHSNRCKIDPIQTKMFIEEISKLIDSFDIGIFFSETSRSKGTILELVSKELNHFGVIADLFRQQQICAILLFLKTFHYKNNKKCKSISIFEK